MKNFKVFIAGLCFGINMIACNSTTKHEEESDSALVAPVDTLGGDTTRNSMTDSSAISGVDTTQRNP